MEGRSHDGRKHRMLNIVDEFTRECLAIRIDRRVRSTDVIDVLSDLFILRGVPGHIRSRRWRAACSFPVANVGNSLALQRKRNFDGMIATKQSAAPVRRRGSQAR